MTKNDNKQPSAYAIRKRETEERAYMVAKAKERFRLALQKKDASNTDAGIDLVEDFMLDVIKGLEFFLDDQMKRMGGGYPFWFKPFCQIKPELIADLCLRTIVDAVGKGWKYGKYVEFAGKAFAGLYVQQMVDGNAQRRKRFAKYEEQMIKAHGSAIRRVEIYWKYAEEKLGFTWKTTKLDADNPHEKERGWTIKSCRIVGNCMLNVILAGTDFASIEKLKKDGDNREARYITLRNEMAKLLDEKNLTLEDRAQWYGPMMGEPNRWGDPEKHGPYNDDAVNHTIDFIRNMQPPQKAQYEELVAQGKLKDVHDAVDAIGAVPLTVNYYVYRALMWSWRTGKYKGVNDFPALDKVPMKPRMPTEEFRQLDLNEQISIASETEDVIKFNNATNGNLTNLKRHRMLAVRMLWRQRRNEIEGFSLPANCDYRGRVYPIPDFNYQKADYMRSLFLFYNKTEVNEESVNDIRLQLANCYGHGADKGSQREMIEWAIKNEDDILKCGRDFKASFDIWSDADAPYQFLAACREMYNYRQHGEGYMTGLPIAQDATQSGVQHYSLALRHTADAKRVNLVDWDENDPTPEDFYEECLVVAKELIQKSLDDNLAKQAADPVTEEDKAAYSAHLVPMKELREAEDDDGKAAEASRWKKTDAAGRFKRDTNILSAQQVQAWYKGPYLPYDRKAIKRNCMVYCYSSRQYGFSRQLRKDWFDELSKMVRDPDHPLTEHPFGADKGFAASTFLGGIHEEAIEQIITSAKDGMKYLCDLTRVLAKENCHLTFLNPVGFPMQQHYCVTKRGHQKLPFFDRPIGAEVFTGEVKKDNDVNYRVDTETVDVDSSVDACSPNIIHSMDSCHLMQTVLLCKQRGLTDLMLVHDSFATTVGNVTKMTSIIKYTLAELYKGCSLYEEVLRQNLPKMEQGLGWKDWAERQVDDKADKKNPDKELLTADDKRRAQLCRMINKLTAEKLDKIDDDDLDNVWWHRWDEIKQMLDKNNIDADTLEGGEVSPQLIADVAGQCFDHETLPTIPTPGDLDLEVVKRSQNSFR